MSSISATSSSSYLTPQQLLQAELQQEVNSGAISSSDQSALSSALNDISTSLQDGGSGSLAAGSSSPGDLTSKINSLIANEVSSGKLTQQQATELQGLFQNAFGGAGAGNLQIAQSAIQSGSPISVGPVPAGAIGGPGAGTLTAAGAIGAGTTSGSGGSGGVHHGHGGHGGASNSSSSNAANGNSDSSSANQILQQFLQSLQSSASSASTYNASGSAASIGDASASASSFLINYQS